MVGGWLEAVCGWKELNGEFEKGKEGEGVEKGGGEVGKGG